jgi:hypothetical protein
MKKPRPKDFGCYGGFNDWPDKASKQRHQAAMSEYQRYLYSKMTDEDKENKNLN